MLTDSVAKKQGVRVLFGLGVGNSERQREMTLPLKTITGFVIGL